MPAGYGRLVRVLPPPKAEVPGPPWEEIESALGFRLAADYRWFCETYGGGSLVRGASAAEGLELEVFEIFT